jgi:hypothetical protein
LCADYDLEQVKPFLLSWKNNAGSAHMTLLAIRLGPELQAFAAAEGIELIDPSPMFDIGFHPLNTRFFWYRLLLRLRAGQYDCVLLTDVRDVIFQSDPFAAPRRKAVMFAKEYRTIALEPDYNGVWVRHVYGEALAEEIEHNLIACAGTTMGTQEGILRYLELMCNELLSRSFDRGANYDQGIHNYIAWKLQPDFIEIDRDDAVMCTVGFINPDDVGFANNQIMINGAFPPVVHQWDRLPALKTYVARQIENPATAFLGR